jgi:hypothetical protein
MSQDIHKLFARFLFFFFEEKKEITFSRKQIE